MASSFVLIESAFLDTRKSLLLRLTRRLGCSQTAEDLVQETCLQIMEQGSVEEIRNPPAYFSRVARNLATDHARKAVNLVRNRHKLLDEDLVCPRPAPDRIAEANQELDILSRLITELPPQCRRIFLLHKVQHLSHGEIAEQLEISPRTVETQIGKALKILRDRMRMQ